MDPFVMNFLSSTPLFHLPDALFRPKTCRIRTFVVPLQSITGNYRHIRLSAKEWTEKTNAIGIISNDYFSFPAQVPVFKMEVVYSGSYIRFDIAGISYRKGIAKCVGEFDGKLVREPNNLYDSNAVKIMHPNGTHVGYVPRNYDGDRARYDVKLPCVCHCIILQGEKGYYGICVVPL